MFFMIVLIIVIVIAVHYFATQNARRLQTLHDLYPYEELSKDPDGDEVYIDREDGTKIRAIAAGDGSTVILAHGYGISLVSWTVLFNRLVQEGYRVIAFDLRGHGKSTIGRDGITSQAMSDDFKAVLDHFDVRDGLIISHSTGGFLSCLFQLNHPETVRQRLKAGIFAGSLLGDVLKGSVQNRFQIPLIKTGIINWVVNSDVYSWSFGASLMGSHPSPAAIRVFNELFAQQPHKQLIPILEALAAEEYYSRLDEIQIPTIVICGKEDKTTPPWHSEEMGKRIPNVQNIWLDGVGHGLNWEAVDDLMTAVKSLE